MQVDFGSLHGVRRPGAALLSITPYRGQSGARPPHSKDKAESLIHDFKFLH